MTRLLRSAVLLLLFVATSAAMKAQPDGEEHPPGQGRQPDTSDKRYFGIRVVNQGDTAFRYFMVRETPARVRPNKTPNGGGNWRPMFSDFNEKLVRFTDSTLVPLKAGRTPLVISYAMYRDTIGLVIEKVGRNLVVDYDRPTLAHARRETLYRVNTWDTAGGAAREKAMGQIMIGMPIDQARSLLNASTVRTSSEFPGTDIVAIDMRRSIYLEEKEGRVSKVWIGPSRLGVVESQ